VDAREAVAGGRVAYLLGATGAAAAIDTACSSSLVAASLALGAVGGSDIGGADGGVHYRQTASSSSGGGRNGGGGGGGGAAAIVSGVSLMLTPNMHGVLGGAGMLSPAGRCRTLDAAADGYARGRAQQTIPSCYRPSFLG